MVAIFSPSIDNNLQKQMRLLADNYPQPDSPLVGSKKNMLCKEKKNKLFTEPQILPIQWYPGSRNCTNRKNKRINSQNIPPLMVRKADWRR